MKTILIVTVVLMLFAEAMAVVVAEGVLDLSALGKKPGSQSVTLQGLTPTMPTRNATNYLGSKTTKGVLDLSTLGKKQFSPLGTKQPMPAVAGTVIKGPTHVTLTPMFSIKNRNITSVANDIITPPQSVTANTTIYTPPFAIFGGA